jgi:hypothetical protein
MKINSVDTAKVVFSEIKPNPRGGEGCAISYSGRPFVIDLFGYITDIEENRITFHLNKNQVKGMIELEDFIEKENQREGYQYARLLRQQDKKEYIMTLKLSDFIIISSDEDKPKSKDTTTIDITGAKNFYDAELEESLTIQNLEEADTFTSLLIRGIVFLNNKFAPVIATRNIKVLTYYYNPKVVIEEEPEIETIPEEKLITILPDDI